MKKQFLVEIEFEENEPELVTTTEIEVILEEMMGGYTTGLIEDGWEVKVSEMKIEDAKKLLVKSGYIVRKWKDNMDDDADKCSNGEEMLCSECSCHICAAGLY